MSGSGSAASEVSVRSGPWVGNDRLVTRPALLHVRAAGEDDASVLEELKWSWATERGETPLSRSEHRQLMLQWISTRPDSHLPFLAFSSNDAVGMAWLALLQRVPGPNARCRLAGDVQSVFVRPEHRSGGTGMQMLEFVIDQARVRHLEFLTVRPSRRSVSLYQRLGFTGKGSILWLPL